jgi:hypothetical protein
MAIWWDSTSSRSIFDISTERSLFSGRLILATRQSDKCGPICDGVHDREEGEEYGNRMSDQIIHVFHSSTSGRPR